MAPEEVGATVGVLLFEKEATPRAAYPLFGPSTSVEAFCLRVGF